MTLDIKTNSVERHRDEEPEIEIQEGCLVCPCRGILKIHQKIDDRIRHVTSRHVRSNPDSATSLCERGTEREKALFVSSYLFIKERYCSQGFLSSGTEMKNKKI